MRGAIIKCFGAPQVIEVLQIEAPIISEPYQVLVNVVCSGINPVDTYIRSGAYANLPRLPYSPGRDGSGIVAQVGSAVTNVKPGQRVWFINTATGSAAEQCLTNQAYPLPPALNFAQGAGIGIPYMTAYRALFILGKAKAGDTIFVHGASGGVGLAACQLAANRGIVVVGSAGTDEGSEMVTRNGCSHVVNHRSAGYLDSLRQRYPNGFSLILEMAAHINLAADLTLLAPEGKVAVIGSRGEVTINPRALMSTEGAVFGVALSRSTAAEYSEMADGINALFEVSDYRPVVGKQYPLEEIAQAHADVMVNAGTKGNLVVNVSDPDQ